MKVLVAISAGVAKELPRMFRKGIRHIKVNSNKKPMINP